MDLGDELRVFGDCRLAAAVEHMSLSRGVVGRSSRGARARIVDGEGYRLAIRWFLAYVCEPLYGWDVECEKHFGTHPIQISHDWNSAKHILDVEGRPQRRALTRAELQLLFNAADEMVEEIRRHGRKGAVAAFRDTALLKTAYAFGLRRQEVVRLEIHDFGRNPKATEFGDFGVCYVRFGKGSHSSGPKRRSVLTVMPWSVDVLTEWVSDIWPYCHRENSAALWPSERSERMSSPVSSRLMLSLVEQRLEVTSSYALEWYWLSTIFECLKTAAIVRRPRVWWLISKTSSVKGWRRSGFFNCPATAISPRPVSWILMS
jgi:hypothetical protein